jgi:hypothetical protein
MHSRFEAGLKRLASIPDVRDAVIGTPASTVKRSVVEDGYAWALLLTFADIAAHDRYQVHPLHDAFVAEFADSWERVQVYDVSAARRTHPVL